MDIAIEPEYYAPSVDEQSNFIDNVPPIVPPGIRCPCNKKLYETRTQFTAHIKTKMHQKWLSDLNINRGNLYTESLKKDEIIEMQKKIIAEQSNVIAQLKHEIHTTSQCLAVYINRSSNTNGAVDLLTFD